MFNLQPPHDDGLEKLEVQSWSVNKHHFLIRYIDAFTTSMKDKRWKGLHYIDLFAGPGINLMKDDGLEWGSALIAAQAPHQFSRLHLCENQEKYFKPLQSRIARFSQPSPPQLIHGDANNVIEDVVQSIPYKALSLAFLDPFGLHLWFDTLKKLSERKVDLIIFFPDHLDALRNWKNVYAGKPDSNLDRVLGGAPWLERFKNTPQKNRATLLTDIYAKQIKTLGYKYSEFERIARPDGVFLYKLLFFSKHEAGVKIWRNTSKKGPDGQYRMDYPE